MFVKSLDSAMMPRNIYLDSQDAILHYNTNTYLFELPQQIQCSSMENVNNNNNK